jgi:hypothetical protein
VGGRDNGDYTIIHSDGFVHCLKQQSTNEGAHEIGKDVKTLLNKSLNIYDVKPTMFCLSFPSRDRATAPGRYEY